MQLIAHRGNNNHGYQENTKEALLDALKENYIDGVECDVRLTKDKRLVLVHDMTINRVSDGSGFVMNKTLRQLRKFNFGTKKHPTKISTLKEFLAKVTSTKVIMIELKSEDLRVKELVDRVVKVCRKYPLNYYFCSFRYDVLKYMKDKYPKLQVGIIVGLGLNEQHQQEFDFVSIEKNKYDNNPRQLFVWTIHNKKQAKPFLKKELYVITDKAYLWNNKES